MAKITSLEVGFGADASDFAEAMDKALDSFKNFHESLKDGAKVFEATRTPLERYETEMDKLGDLLKKGAISQDTFNRAARKAEADVTVLAEAVEKPAKSISKLSTVMDSIGGPIGNFGKSLMSANPIAIAATVATAGLAAAAVAAKAAYEGLQVIVDKTMQSFENIDALDDAAAKIGISTEALSALRYAAGFADVSMSALDTSIGKMNVNIVKAAEGSKPLAAAFEKLGLDAKELQAAGTEKAFGMIADALAAIPDHAERSARAVEIFGKSGKELLPILSEGSEAIRAWTEEGRNMGVVISDVDAAKVAEAADAMTRLGAMWDGVGNTLAIKVAPLIETISKSMGDIGLAGGSIGEQISFGVDVAVRALANLANALDLANRVKNLDALNTAPLAGTKFLGEYEKTQEAADLRAQRAAAEARGKRKGAALGNDEADGGMGAPIDFDPAELDKPKRTGSSGGGPASDIARRQLDELQKSRMIQEKIEVNTRGRAPVASID